MNLLDWLKNEQNLSVLRAFQSILTMVAIVVGGSWAYFLFVRRRQKYPRANITQRIRRYPLPNGKLLLRVIVQISNDGEILLSLVSGFCRVQQMIPCADDLCNALEERDDSDEQCEPEADWHLICEWKLKLKKRQREIEPGETDELHFDFVLDTDVEVVVVYSYLKNAKKRRREIGWNVTSVYDLRYGA